MSQVWRIGSQLKSKLGLIFALHLVKTAKKTQVKLTSLTSSLYRKRPTTRMRRKRKTTLLTKLRQRQFLRKIPMTKKVQKRLLLKVIESPKKMRILKH